MALPGASGERRRRILTEQVISTPSVAGTSKPTTGDGASGPHYEREALASQPAITAILPLRCRTILLQLILFGAAAAGIVYLQTCLPKMTAKLGPAATAGLDLTERGNLGTWLASALLLFAALQSVAIYSVRRFKVDDYKGRYRLWLQFATLLVVLSAAITVRLDRTIAVVGETFSPWKTWQEGTLWWLVPFALCLTGMGLRLLLDIRRSKLALLSLLLAIVSLAVCLVAGLTDSLHIVAVSEEQLQRILWGTGYGSVVLLLTALAANGRFVLLDAAGEIAARKPKVAKRSKKTGKSAKKQTNGSSDVKQKTAAAATTANQSERDTTSRSNKKNERKNQKSQDRSRNGQQSQQRDDEDDEDQEQPTVKLSRAERKRLRKQRSQQRAA